MTIKIPELALVVLVGPSGSGKSTLARKLFKSTEILSSDICRGLVSDDENNQTATKDAFEVLHFIASKRLAAGKLTVIDATNVQEESRKPLVELARKFHCLPVALVLNVDEWTCHDRNKMRGDRTFGPHVVRQQCQQLRRSLRHLQREGFRHVFTLETAEQIEAATVVREPLWNNRKSDRGPFDIIGDIHGCCDELLELLQTLGYARSLQTGAYTHPLGRKLIFLGDLVDRGPNSPEVVFYVMEAVKHGTALCVPGNHDMKFMRAIWGKKVQISHGLAESLEQFKAYEKHYHGFSRIAADFIDSLVSHYILDDGKLVVAHAGMREDMQGRGSGKVREFALYGETTGETDDFGLPVRYNWAADYRGNAHVVYGHTPIPEPQWLNKTLNIDTGCVFGGKLTALRYPEMELVAVPAKQTYAQPARPFLEEPAAPDALSAQHQHDDLLNIDDVLGKRIISTRHHHNVTIREENAIAALEIMSRFAVNPKWLIYLPPTMSPCATSQREGTLEHPEEAFAYFRQEGVPQVICQQKHMGSRAVVIICRDAGTARKRFGITTGEQGICITRTGRRFFDDRSLEQQLLARVADAVTSANLWEELATDWLCLDCELMPWSAKAQSLIKDQYASVACAGTAALAAVNTLLAKAAAHEGPTAEAAAKLNESFAAREQNLHAYTAAYRRYCWPVSSIDDYKLAPFHIMASENTLHINRDHLWHMALAERLATADAAAHEKPILLATPYRLVNTTDEASQKDATDWWEHLTSAGGEGMVVKPLTFLTRGTRGLVQPAIKCRGREYLRIIYGPDYTLPHHLARLRQRGLGAKRSLALREFALGLESLERFIRHEPLTRVHECAFAVLALESEPVDPTL